MYDDTHQEPPNKMTPSIEPSEPYIAWVQSRDLSGECRLRVGPERLQVASVHMQRTISFADILSISLVSETVRISVEGFDYIFSRLGRSCSWFHEELLEAYYRRTLESLLCKGVCILRAHGQFSITETLSELILDSEQIERIESQGEIMVYPDAIYLLPPNTRARRLPLLFLDEIHKEGQSLLLRFRFGEIAQLSMLGRSLGPMEQEILSARKVILRQNQALLHRICPAAAVFVEGNDANFLPFGIAIPMRKIKEFSKDLLECLNPMIEKSQMSETVPVITGFALKESACIGILEMPSNAEGNINYALWVIASAENDRVAIVELALPDEKAATYVFCIQKTFEHFVSTLNRAFEATGFSRELFTMTDEEIASEAREKERMLLIRTPSVRLIRRMFSARVIHRSLETWTKQLTDACFAVADSQKTNPSSNHNRKGSRPDEILWDECAVCHVRMEKGLRFCRACGTEVRVPDVHPLCFCRNCGESILPGTRFCMRCGKSIG